MALCSGRDLKNFIGDRASNVTKEDTVQRCSKGLNALKNVRVQFGDSDTIGGSHKNPLKDRTIDVKRAARTLNDDIFEDHSRKEHPLVKIKALFAPFSAKEKAAFKRFLTDNTCVKVLEDI